MQMAQDLTTDQETDVPTLHLRIHTEGWRRLSLDSVYLEEVYKSFRDALAIVINPVGYLTDEQANILKYDQLYGEDEDYFLETEGNEGIEEGLRVLFTALQKREYQNLPLTCLVPLEELAEEATRHNYDYEFDTKNISEMPSVKIGCNDGFDLPERTVEKYMSEFSGKVLSVAKENKTAKLELIDRRVIDIAVDKHSAESLEAKIHQDIVFFARGYRTLPDKKYIFF